jgi:hypothetical protein
LLDFKAISYKKYAQVSRGKRHNKTETKTTVSLYLSRNLVEEARNQGLNISRITEQTLSSILDYSKTQNSEKRSQFLSTCSLRKESVVVPRAGFEPSARAPLTPANPLFLYWLTFVSSYFEYRGFVQDVKEEHHDKSLTGSIEDAS